MSPLSVLPHRDNIGMPAGRLLIDGTWGDGGGEPWSHVHPATNEELATFAVATAADVDRAVRAARRAFDEGPWRTMQARQRKRLLQRVATLVGDHVEELNRIQALDNGVPIGFTSVYQLSAEMAADVFDYHAGWVDRLGGETLPSYRGVEMLTITLREPVGVVGAIIPWNAPLMLFAQKVAPALAAGCTVVLKPSEFASFAAVRMAELLHEADLPPGVFNLVLGPGPETGQALLDHPGVDKLTFTGSRATGQRVMVAAANRIARVSLELGGKSPNIVFPDVDLDTAALGAFGMIGMGLSGQGCVCHTRLLVHRSIYDAMVEKTSALGGIVRYGDPFDPATNSSALINRRQLDKVLGYIAKGQEEGARLVSGGDRPDGDLAAGNFVNAAVFADVDHTMTIAREEIFGPVLAITPFEDEDDAIRMANQTDYGLGASVQTRDIQRALRVAKAVRAGTFGVNGYTVMPNAPFGGMAASGIGREGGAAGVEAFTELKTVTIQLRPGF